MPSEGCGREWRCEGMRAYVRPQQRGKAERGAEHCKGAECEGTRDCEGRECEGTECEVENEGDTLRGPFAATAAAFGDGRAPPSSCRSSSAASGSRRSTGGWGQRGTHRTQPGRAETQRGSLPAGWPRRDAQRHEHVANAEAHAKGRYVEESALPRQRPRLRRLTNGGPGSACTCRLASSPSRFESMPRSCSVWSVTCVTIWWSCR